MDFAVRSKLGLSTFFEDVVAERWKIDFYTDSCATIAPQHRYDETVASQPIDVEALPTNHSNVRLSQSQKYRSAFLEAQKLATLASEVSMQKYLQRLSVLRSLVARWEQKPLLLDSILRKR